MIAASYPIMCVQKLCVLEMVRAAICPNPEPHYDFIFNMLTALLLRSGIIRAAQEVSFVLIVPDGDG